MIEMKTNSKYWIGSSSLTELLSSDGSHDTTSEIYSQRTNDWLGGISFPQFHLC